MSFIGIVVSNIAWTDENHMSQTEQIELKRFYDVIRLLHLIKPLVAELVYNMNAGHMGPGAPGVGKSVLTQDFGQFKKSDHCSVPPSKDYNGTMAQLYQQVAKLEQCVLHEPKYTGIVTWRLSEKCSCSPKRG